MQIANGALTVDKLEGYLWSFADILRGSIDSSDYKDFILQSSFSNVSRTASTKSASSS